MVEEPLYSKSSLVITPRLLSDTDIVICVYYDVRGLTHSGETVKEDNHNSHTNRVR